jgi:hypothetical protein
MWLLPQICLWEILACLEQCQFPHSGCRVISEDAHLASRRSHLKVAMVWCQPTVDNLGNLDQSVTEPKTKRRFLAAIARVAVDRNAKRLAVLQPLFHD